MVDSRYNLLKFRGMTACTPNESEVEQALGIKIGDNARALERAGRELLATTRSAAVLITRGSRGMALFEAGRPTVHIPIVGSDQIADVTGAKASALARPSTDQAIRACRTSGLASATTMAVPS